MTAHSGHETSLGSRSPLHRADTTPRKVRESRIVCDRCKGEVHYFTEPLYGRSLERCLCGTRLMQRHVEATVIVPDNPDYARYGGGGPRVEDKTCPCGRTFRTFIGKRASSTCPTCRVRVLQAKRKAQGYSRGNGRPKMQMNQVQRRRTG